MTNAELMQVLRDSRNTVRQLEQLAGAERERRVKSGIHTMIAVRKKLIEVCEEALGRKEAEVMTERVF